MFALQCIGSLGNSLPLAEYIHSSADEMLIWGPETNVFDTSLYLVNTLLLNEPFLSLSVYPREAFILRALVLICSSFLWDVLSMKQSEDDRCVVLCSSYLYKCRLSHKIFSELLRHCRPPIRVLGSNLIYFMS